MSMVEVQVDEISESTVEYGCRSGPDAANLDADGVAAAFQRRTAGAGSIRRHGAMAARSCGNREIADGR